MKVKYKGKDGRVDTTSPKNLGGIESGGGGGGFLLSYVVAGGVCGMQITTSYLYSLVFNIFVAIISTHLLIKIFKGVCIISST